MAERFFQNTIALVYDFDGTLSPQPMQEYTVLPKIGVEPSQFWARVNREGWGAALLARQEPDGQWGGGAFFPREGWDRDAGEGQPWTATEPTLTLLRTFGATLPDVSSFGPDANGELYVTSLDGGVYRITRG